MTIVEDIKLTIEEEIKIETEAKQQAKISLATQDIDIDGYTIQEIINRVDKLIVDKPHLNYASIRFDVCTYDDCSDDITLSYIEVGDWEPIYKRLCEYKLRLKRNDYTTYKRLQEQFGDIK